MADARNRSNLYRLGHYLSIEFNIRSRGRKRRHKVFHIVELIWNTREIYFDIGTSRQGHKNSRLWFLETFTPQSPIPYVFDFPQRTFDIHSVYCKLDRKGNTQAEAKPHDLVQRRSDNSRNPTKILTFMLRPGSFSMSWRARSLQDLREAGGTLESSSQ